MQEIISKRSKTSKTYDLGNGNNRVEIFKHPLHFEGVNGWEDIDTKVEFEAGFGHKIKNANFNLRWNKKTLRFGFSKNVYIDYNLPSEAMVVDGHVATFQSAWDHSDLRYTVCNDGIKCDIILHSQNADKVFNFPVALKNCDLVVANNTVKIMSNSVMIGIIPAPYMTDARGNNGDVTVSYANGILTFTPNVDFLQNAMYPVIIDPSTFQTAAGGDDGYIGGTNTYDSSNTYCQVGQTYESNSLWARFPNVTVPKSSTISAAKITYIAYANLSGTTPTRVYFDASDNASAPSNYAGYTGKSTTTAYVAWSMADFTSGTSYDSPDIKDVVQEIVNRSGWSSGNAMQLLHKDNGSTSYKYRQVKTYNNGSTLGPKLTIDYSSGDNEFVIAPIGTATSVGLASTTTLAMNLSVAPSTGTATSAGLNSITSTVSNLTVTPTIGTATSSGNTPYISSPVNIGTSTSTGLNATVSLTMNLTVSPSIGTATSSGYSCEVSTPIDIGTATSTGLTPTISTSSGTMVIPSIGTATSTGLDTTVLVGGNATATPTTGTATSSGLAPTVNVSSGLQILCDIGDSISIGLAPSITNLTEQVVNVSVGASLSEGSTPNVSTLNTVNVTTPSGTSMSTGLAPIISINVNSSISIGIAISTGFNSTATNNTTIVVPVGIGTALSRGNKAIVVSSTENVIVTKKNNQRIKLGLGLGI